MFLQHAHVRHIYILVVFTARYIYGIIQSSVRNLHLVFSSAKTTLTAYMTHTHTPTPNDFIVLSRFFQFSRTNRNRKKNVSLMDRARVVVVVNPLYRFRAIVDYCSGTAYTRIEIDFFWVGVGK